MLRLIADVQFLRIQIKLDGLTQIQKRAVHGEIDLIFRVGCVFEDGSMYLIRIERHCQLLPVGLRTPFWPASQTPLCKDAPPLSSSHVVEIRIVECSPN